MPTYEYRCEHCGDFEENQRITDPPLERCPKCRRKVRRLISNTSFQLKGSGWYVTDYARSGSGSKDNAKSDKSGDGKSESKSESKSDGKSESKSESKTESKSESKSDSKPTSGGSTEKPAS
jgi:putative FmdB family regulatory protein